LPMRKKESENDYRYFPDPDLPPIVLTADYLNEIQQEQNTLPIDVYLELRDKYQLSHADAELLTENKTFATYFTEAASLSVNQKDLSELLIQKIIPYIRTENLTLESLGDMNDIIIFVTFINNGRISKSMAYQHVFPEWILDISQNPEEIAFSKELLQSTNQDFLDPIIYEVINNHPDKASEYRKGRKGLLGFFMGKVMQKSGGKADPKVLQEKVVKALS
ncbi:MAG: Asp-tRNA(Asn)/Glu-tRNA(Gln) amidotransferase GatCAB subunit B, partial [Saprospiraceae bacterium]|nr:Asp-tRNA(Asn)/Glu-tRNA(Gln) amidotransferase GatCAB subunit B [Saprospiraceae bacterium]